MVVRPTPNKWWDLEREGGYHHWPRRRFPAVGTYCPGSGFFVSLFFLFFYPMKGTKKKGNQELYSVQSSPPQKKPQYFCSFVYVWCLLFVSDEGRRHTTHMVGWMDGSSGHVVSVWLLLRCERLIVQRKPFFPINDVKKELSVVWLTGWTGWTGFFLVFFFFFFSFGDSCQDCAPSLHVSYQA